MLVFTGRLVLFLSLLAWRIVESLLSLSIRLIFFWMNSAWKNINLLILHFQSSFLSSKAEI